MRLGLDIGTNSIGWWLYETDGDEAGARITGVIGGGVRVFSDGRDPQSGASLAVDRRAARAMRRRRDRYLRRRATLMKVLANAGLMPADPVEAKTLEALDPYALRATGLDAALPLTHLGRALFHINQRRGFKSNRKTDRGDNESGKIKDATARLEQAMMASGARTYGEFLHMRRQRLTEKPSTEPKINKDGTRLDYRNVPTVRTRLSIAKRDGPDGKEEAGYDFYPDRKHLEEEFHRLWAAQARHHPGLTDDLRDLVFEKIFFQRPLKEPKVGLCLFTAEERLPKAHPLTQRRVLFETVNQLRVTADGRETRPLTIEERDQIVHALDNKKHAKKPPMSATKGPTLTLKHLAEKVLRLPDGQRFTLETGVRDAIACDPVRASLSHPDRFGSRWSVLDADAQWEVISRIRKVQSDADHAVLIDWLMQEQEHGLDRDHAEASARAPLPEGYGRLGATATTRILDRLKADVITYAQAVAACGWHHSDQRTGECLERLPYYGKVLDRHVIPGTYDEKDDDVSRFGRITNPTVHIGLNQLKRVVNKIIEVYGKPDQIVVELARELKQSEQQKKDAMQRIRDTTEAAKKRSKKLEELGYEDNGGNRMLLRLWEDLNPDDCMRRFCPYTGERISATMIFDGGCDVDHILPYSRTLDDSFANRTLCLTEANREKRNKTPWEAFGGTPKWDAIEANLKNLPENKRWRFAPDAMRRFEGENDFLDRALVDTQYLARISRTYLDTLFTEGGHVWVVPGRLTEMLRRHWGLNSLLSDQDRGAVKAKNRTDHRHHAIDAAVVAATDRSLLNRISRAAGQGEEAGQSAEIIAHDTPPPWEGFRSDLEVQLSRIIVSHRADHGRIDKEARKHGRDSTAGQLHQETAYSIVDDIYVASRTDLLSVKPAQLLDKPGRSGQVRDPQLRMALRVATRNKTGKDYEKALRDFASKPGPYHGIRRVRIIKPLQEQARVPVPAQDPIKAYQGGSNHVFEIWRCPDGRIEPRVVTTFEAHGEENSKNRRHPAAKRLLRVHKGDMVALERDGRTVVGHVQQMHIKNGLFIVPHNEANADARNSDKTDPFKWIQIAARPAIVAGIRRVAVDEIGRLRDGGAKPT